MLFSLTPIKCLTVQNRFQPPQQTPAITTAQISLPQAIFAHVLDAVRVAVAKVETSRGLITADKKGAKLHNTDVHIPVLGIDTERRLLGLVRKSAGGDEESSEEEDSYGGDESEGDDERASAAVAAPATDGSARSDDEDEVYEALRRKSFETKEGQELAQRLEV